MSAPASQAYVECVFLCALWKGISRNVKSSKNQPWISQPRGISEALTEY